MKRHSRTGLLVMLAVAVLGLTACGGLGERGRGGLPERMTVVVERVQESCVYILEGLPSGTQVNLFFDLPNELVLLRGTALEGQSLIGELPPTDGECSRPDNVQTTLVRIDDERAEATYFPVGERTGGGEYEYSTRASKEGN